MHYTNTHIYVGHDTGRDIHREKYMDLMGQNGTQMIPHKQIHFPLNQEKGLTDI